MMKNFQYLNKRLTDEEEFHHEDEGPSEPIQPIVMPESRKIPNWLKSTLLDAEVHGSTQGTFRESKKPKRKN